MKVCAEPGCPELTHGTRCTEHARAKDRARGTRQQRGYDAAFDATGRDYQRRMDAGETLACWRCGQPVGARRGRDWVLGHCDLNRATIHGPEHPGENYATSGRAANTCPHPSHR